MNQASLIPVNGTAVNWYVWLFLANTGLRRSELLNLDWSNIQDNTIHIVSTEAKRTKSGKWRPVPLSEGAQYALNRFGKHFGNKKKTGLIYTSTAPSLSRAFSRVLKRSEIQTPHGSLHSLRHSFCSHLVMSGVDLTTVQRLAGHSTSKVTEQYAHLAPDHLEQSTSRLDL